MTTASDIHKTNHTPSSSSAWNTTTRHTNRILFASCHSQHYDYEQDGTGKKDDNRHDPQHEAAVSKIRKNNIWQAMTQRQASAFVWAGDAIYGDDFDYINFCNYYLPRFMATTMINKESTRVRRAWNRLCEEWLPHKSLPRPATPAQLETLYAHLLQKNGPYAHPYRRFVSSQPYLTVLGALDDHGTWQNDNLSSKGDRYISRKTVQSTLSLSQITTTASFSFIPLLYHRLWL